MAFRYLLDTNICIYIIKQQPRIVLERFEQLEVGMVGMSAITYGELLYGANKSNNSEKAVRNIYEIGHYIPAIPISDKVPKFYAEIRADLEKQGKMIGNNDLWIAAHCLELELTLITNNEKEFARVNNLEVENLLGDN